MNYKKSENSFDSGFPHRKNENPGNLTQFGNQSIPSAFHQQHQPIFHSNENDRNAPYQRTSDPKFYSNFQQSHQQINNFGHQYKEQQPYYQFWQAPPITSYNHYPPANTNNIHNTQDQFYQSNDSVPQTSQNWYKNIHSSAVNQNHYINQPNTSNNFRQNEYQNDQQGSSNYDSNKRNRPNFQHEETVTKKIKTDFDEQFEKWEKEFMEWQRLNSNHPDKNAYNKYAAEFEKVRQQLLKRRAQMQKNNKLFIPPPPPPEEEEDPAKNVQLREFQNQWNTTKFSSTTETKEDTARPKKIENENFQDDDAFQFISFGDSTKKISKTLNLNLLSEPSEIPFLGSNEKEIPIQGAEAQVSPIPVVTLDDDECDDDMFEFPDETTKIKLEAPPMPQFVIPNEIRDVEDIRKILDVPTRYDRFDKIAIFIRGAPGSGKTHLAKLMLQRERKYNVDRSKFLSIHKFTRKTSFEREKSEIYKEKLMQDLKDTLKTRFHNFVVIEVEGYQLTEFKKLAQIVAGCLFKAYVIELHQPLGICLQYNINERSFDDIEKAVNGLGLRENRPPFKMVALNPAYLLNPNYKDEPEETLPIPINNTAAGPSIDFTTLLQDKRVLELVQSKINQNFNQNNSQQQVQQQQELKKQHESNNTRYQNSGLIRHDNKIIPNHNEQTYYGTQSSNFAENDNSDIQKVVEEIPVYEIKKSIDYQHKSLSTLEDQMIDFKIFKVVDYKHRTTGDLYKFVRDVDLNKVVEKKKSIMQRKKILNYLKNAERPEDTVSNPKYPKNWEVIQVDRPKPKTKRGKRKVGKIKRLYPTKVSYLKNATEEISSDEEMMDVIAEENVEENKNWTIPNFKLSRKNINCVKEILNYPARLVRPSQIMIILRGASGSGKSHLAQLIKRKEREMKNESVRILSIDDYFESMDEDFKDNDRNAYQKIVESFLDQMVKQLERTIKDEFNFIIIDAENCNLKYYHIFYALALRKFYTIYTIELHQTLDICLKQNKLSKFKRPDIEISESIEVLAKNPIPTNHNLLDPTSLYEEYKCLINEKISSLVKDAEDISDDEKFSDEDEMFLELPDDPRIPDFNWHSRIENVKNIKELLENPGRKKRAEKIMIILRGPPGSGKTYLSGLIRNKEIEKGASGSFISLSIDDYFIDKSTLSYRYNAQAVTNYHNLMIKNLREIIRNKNNSFIVIDAENGNLENYNDFYSIGSRSGYTCYSIELNQTLNICKSQNIHERSVKDIEDVLDCMKLHPLPESHTLLIPIYLYNETGETEFENMKMSVDILVKQTLPVMVNGEIVKIAQKHVKIPEFNWHNRDVKDFSEVLSDISSGEFVFIILRGAPGSGKTFLSSKIAQKLNALGMKDEYQIISFEDRFSQVKIVNFTRCLHYNYNSEKYDEYMESMVKIFKEVVSEKKKKVIIIDADNCESKYYNQFHDIGTSIGGYIGYTLELNQDEDVCISCNIHKRSVEEIKSKISALNENQVPSSHKLADAELLYDPGPELMEISDEEEFESSFGPLKKSQTASKWEQMDQQESVRDKLDGVKNKTLVKMTMAEYLKINDEWQMRPSENGKKRVRWADIEEKKNQERLRSIGFIVGQTDWNRITDTSDGKSALEKTRFIPGRKMDPTDSNARTVQVIVEVIEFNHSESIKQFKKCYELKCDSDPEFIVKNVIDYKHKTKSYENLFIRRKCKKSVACKNENFVEKLLKLTNNEFDCDVKFGKNLIDSIQNCCLYDDFCKIDFSAELTQFHTNSIIV